MKNNPKYLVNFDHHVQAVISIEDNSLRILKVIGGWGNDIPLNLVKVEEIK